MSERQAKLGTALAYAAVTREYVTVHNTRAGPIPDTIHHAGQEWANLPPLDERHAPSDVPPVGALAFVDLTRAAAQRAYTRAVAGWPYNPEHVRRRRDLKANLLFAADRCAADLVTVTPALRHALATARERVLWVEHNAHAGARWQWEDEQPFLTCNACGAAHPSAAMVLAAAADHLRRIAVAGDTITVDVPEDTLYLGQAPASVKLNTCHNEAPATWWADHHDALHTLTGAAHVDFRAEAQVPA